MGNDLHLQLGASTLQRGRSHRTAVPVRREEEGEARCGGGHRLVISATGGRWGGWVTRGLLWRIRRWETKTMEIEGWSGVQLCFRSSGWPATCIVLTLTLDMRDLLHFSTNNCRQRSDFKLSTSQMIFHHCVTNTTWSYVTKLWLLMVLCVVPVLCVCVCWRCSIPVIASKMESTVRFPAGKSALNVRWRWKYLFIDVVL